MNTRLHIWKEWIICKRTYLRYIVLIYVLVNIMLLNFSSLKIDFTKDIQVISIDYIIKLMFIYVASIFMLMSMINQSIGLERISGHIHTLLAYKIPLSRIIIIKSIFIVLITWLEVIIMIVIYCWYFWGKIYFSLKLIPLFIFLLLAIMALVLFLSSINILACYIFPKSSQVFSIISFGGCFLILSFYQVTATFFVNYTSIFIFISIYLFGFLEYILILIANRIPNNIILKY